ncbi:hypothetical protein [Nitrosomonas sp. Nm33]|uniref:hypothetical protein n=1 Tax=Nitrosomonas sp. Nm33 TaxID=133724 RepID=UPI00089949D9|nr:hypothetical protein [Nitrosomonas sp. Nm33]SDY71039.1 hypothetical protein SAMN05421755_104122 [Nitrosomonas sp. Nm33]
MTTTSKKTEPTAAHTGSNISKITISSDTRRLSPEDPPIFLHNREGRLIAGIKLEKQEVTNNAIRLTGWSLGSSGLALLRDGKEVDVEILRFSRHDVLEAYSVTSDVESGYEITIEYPEEGAYSLRWYLTNSGKITHDDFDLGIIITAVSDSSIKRKQETAVPPQTLNKLSDSNVIHANIEEINNFSIRGWCLIEEHSPKAMVLRIGQSEYPVQLYVIRERKDVSKQFSINEDKVGFEMHLPGYIWDGIPESNDLEIEILAEGYALTKMPLIVTRKVAVQWIEQIFYQSENQNQQFFGLVALEHIRFGCLMPMLSAEVQAAVKLFTAKMNLGDYPPGVEGTDKDVPAESFVTLMHWKALRQLNELLTDATTPQTVFQAVIDVMDRSGLILIRTRNCINNPIPASYTFD